MAADSINARFAASPDGTRLAWDETGAGVPVLLVHGIGYTRSKWAPQVSALAAAGYRVVRYDLRGFGDSSPPVEGAELSAFIEDLATVVHAAGLSRFHVVGHSLGGMLAQKFALAHPGAVRSLTLVSTTSHNGRRATAFARLMTQFATHGFDRVMGDAGLRAAAEATLREAFPAGMSPELLRPGTETPNPGRASAWRACIEFSTKDELPNLRCPALVAHGTADRLIPFRAGELVRDAIPGAAWHVEEGAGHSLPKQRAESFNHALLSFLRQHAG